MKIPIFPDQASSSAQQVDYLYFGLTAVSLLVSLLVFGAIIVFLFKYRRGHRANRSALNISTTKIEITWTVLPLLLAMGMFGWGARVYLHNEIAPQDAMEINVVAKQWMWKLQHAEGPREINELHMPVDRSVKLIMASEDVIHSFYVPAFRVKQDLVPGRFSTTWFRPIRPGRYHLFCAEYCGTDHSQMIGSIVVMEPAQYQAWLAQGKEASSLAQSGGNLFRVLGCSGCHSGNSPVRAPPLEGLYGRWVPLQSGQIVKADDQYLRDSILLPNLQVAAGYDPVMPSFQGRINEEDLFQIVAYLKSLGPQAPPPPL